MRRPTAEFSRYLVTASIVAACYFCAAWVGLKFAIPPGCATALWPASGIAFAALILLGNRLWPAVWIGAFLANLTTDSSFGLCLTFATGNTLEALLGSWLFKRYLSEEPFSAARDAFVFLAIAVTACLPAATVGGLSMFLAEKIGSSEILANWSTWFLGDLVGLVVVVPLILAIVGRRWEANRAARVLELLLLFSLQVSLSLFLFGGLLPERIAEQGLYLPMVLLIWCCLRFGLVEVTTGTLLFSAAAIWGTWLGIGAYGSSVFQENLFDLQALLLTYAMTTLAMISLVTSQRKAQSSSTRSQRELQRQTAERNRVEKWFQQLLIASPDALVVSDAAGRIVLVNDAAERLFGYTRVEMIGQPIEILVPPRHRERHRENRERYNQAPFVRLMGSGIELTGCRKDGSEFPAEIALGPTRTDQGLVVFSAVRDVSSRKRAERALQSSEERFMLAVQGTDAGIWDWDLRTDKVYFSPRWKSILGYGPEELRDDFEEWTSRLHPDDRDEALLTVQDYLDGRTTEYELEHRLLHKDGSYRWILARGAAVRDRDGKPYRMVGSHIDITDRKSLEEQLRVQLAQLIAAEEIQTYLLPRVPPSIPGFDIAGRCYPAEFAAGDHFDFLFRKDGTFVPVIGDVSGHGIGPAIMMAFSHAHLRSLLEVHDDLCELIARVNVILSEESPIERFLTLLAAVIDPQTKTLSYVRCGHPPGFIMNQAGEVTLSMDSGSLPLGVAPEAEFQQSAASQLHPGDIVVMLTDGILEACSPKKTYFGLEGTVDTLRHNRSRSAREIIVALREAVRSFTGKDTLADDITLVVIKVH